ncbi:Ger(x)C family spore germination protein [Paenibacillus sp. MMS20-IR301]|uniref:Ger(x)C family spore germination protein n=1 Tax=Paenibacillus sp. MMS20-IR301 TaxID=2895946 RepID=UPI0028E7151B|nr:Ger(x)C family spore germination protein [Paenibacillus sp. MMS20-IR301]WNS43509.1 Ger(x)C family spore germination protein [Paenibacillus sp. MMS20-IR301]
MRGRRMLAILLILGLASMLTGCWSRKELNELALVMALGIDLDPEGYAVSAQVMNPSEAGNQKGASSGSLPVVTYKSVGKTVPDALQRMLSMTPRMLYLAHIRVIVFGEELARSGVSDALDFLSRDNQTRTDFYLLVAKNSTASKILEIVTPFEHIPANSLYSSILVSHKKWAATGKVTLQQFITELERGGSNPIMSGVQLRGNLQNGESPKNVQNISPQTLIQHAGIAVFKKDKLVGWLGEPLSKSVNYALNEVDTTVGNVPSPEGGTAGFIVTQADTRLDIKINEEGKPEFIVKLNIEADLTTVEGPLDLNNPANLKIIEDNLQNRFNIKMSSDIREIQEKYNSDIFGFGEALHRKYPRLWKDYREHWEDTFKTVKVDVHSKVAIRRIGSIIQPLKKEIEEK